MADTSPAGRAVGREEEEQIFGATLVETHFVPVLVELRCSLVILEQIVQAFQQRLGCDHINTERNTDMVTRALPSSMATQEQQQEQERREIRHKGTVPSDSSCS